MDMITKRKKMGKQTNVTEPKNGQHHSYWLDQLGYVVTHLSYMLISVRLLINTKTLSCVTPEQLMSACLWANYTKKLGSDLSNN